MRATLTFSAIGVAAVVMALAMLRIDPEVAAGAGSHNRIALVPFWAAALVAWAGLTMLWRRLDRAPGRWRSRDAGIVLLVAALARAAIVGWHDPALSDDVYRYVLDGRNGAAGINPYLETPAQMAGIETGGAVERPLGDRGDDPWRGRRALVARVNNPELHTAYLPVSEWTFIAAGALVPDAWSDPDAGARLFRAAFCVIELSGIAVMLVVLRRAGRSPWWAALYAWHPLPLAEIAGSGHQDAIGVTLMLAALALATARGRVWLWTIPLALAAMVKPVAVPVAAVLLREERWCRWILSACVGAAVCAAVAAPLLLTHGGEPLANAGATGARFSLKWAHFGPVYEPVLRTIERLTLDPADDPAGESWTNDDRERLARLVCLTLLGAVAIAILARPRDPWRAAAALLTAMVLLSPAAHPWYLLWALALAPLAMSATLWTLSLTILLGYAAWIYAPGANGELRWGAATWVMWVAYIPVAGGLLADGLARRRHAALAPVEDPVEDPDEEEGEEAR